MHSYRITIEISLFVLLLLGVGCNSGTPTADDTQTQWMGAGNSDLDPETSSPTNFSDADQVQIEHAFDFQAPSELPDDAKLAALRQQYSADVAGIKFDSAPEAVSQVFVSLLHADDLMTAERLLTLRSRAIIRESGLELGAIAGPQAQYVMGESRYATNLRELAYVDCFVFDPELVEQGDLETGKFKVTWVLRQESGFGWRIYGMVSEEAGQLRLINFENPQHATAISQMYESGALNDGEKTRNAAATSLETIR